MRIGIFGRGRMASAVAAAAPLRGVEVAWALGRGEEPRSEVDACLDASAAEAVESHLAWAVEARSALVIGTTGWNRSLLTAERAGGIGVMVAPNFSLGAAFLRRAAAALGGLAALDGGSDLAILERHHRAKADAPSGTARSLAEALVAACPRYSGWCQGSAVDGKISVASLRAGTEIGYHEIRLMTGGETIVLSHEARTREVFASGALLALEWIRGREGIHGFDEMAGELLGPLFAALG